MSEFKSQDDNGENTRSEWVHSGYVHVLCRLWSDCIQHLHLYRWVMVRRFQGSTRSGHKKKKVNHSWDNQLIIVQTVHKLKVYPATETKDKTEACSLKSVCPENFSWHQHIVSWNSHAERLESVRRRVRKLFHSVWTSGVFGAKENTLFHSTTQMSGLLKAITQKTACWVLMLLTHTHTHHCTVLYFKPSQKGLHMHKKTC